MELFNYQEVANYLNNKFGDDYTMAELSLDKPQRLVIVKNWNDADEWMRNCYAEAQKEEKNLVGFAL